MTGQNSTLQNADHDTIYPFTNDHQPPRAEIEARLARFRQGLYTMGLGGALITHRVDLFYLTGTGQEGWLWVPAAGSPGGPKLLIRREIGRARRESPLGDIEPMNGIRDLARVVPSGGGPVGLELDVLPAALYISLGKHLGGVEFWDVSWLIRGLRAVKSEYELGWHRLAAAMNAEMFARVGGWIHSGMREVELAAEIERFYRRQGHFGDIRMRAFNGEVFYGHIMTGPNLAESGSAPGPTTGLGLSPAYPQGVGWRRVGPGEPIMVDYVALAGGYQIDQARIFVIGPAPDEVRRANEVCLAVQGRIEAEAGPGVRAEALYDAALEVVAAAGVGAGFQGLASPVPFVGHGIGLELDEWPVLGRGSRHVLERGMVFTLEPKIHLPGVGLGGIENSYVVTGDGLEKLTNYPDDIEIVGVRS